MDICDFRAEIDRLDAEIARLLKKRFEISEEIGRAKKKQGIGVEDLERDKEVLNNYRSQGLDEQFIEELVTLILEHSKGVQRN